LNSEILNKRAMSALLNGEFETAQELFYLNKNTNPCFQTYNNLGLFLYQHGIVTKSGKEMCAESLGKRYLLKASIFQKNAIVFMNLGEVFFNERKYNESYEFYSSCYSLLSNDYILYDRAISLFMQKKYKNAFYLFRNIKSLSNEMIFPFFVSMAMYDKKSLILGLNANQYNEQISRMDLLDRVIFYYLCEKYSSIIEIEERLNEEWSLSYGEWAILIEAFCKQHESERVNLIIKKKLECCETYNQKRLFKEVQTLYRCQEKRKATIKNYFDELVFAPMNLCGYFGCDLHLNSWGANI